MAKLDNRLLFTGVELAELYRRLDDERFALFMRKLLDSPEYQQARERLEKSPHNLGLARTFEKCVLRLYIEALTEPLFESPYTESVRCMGCGGVYQYPEGEDAPPCPRCGRGTEGDRDGARN